MVATCSAGFCQQELGAGITWFLFPPQPNRKRIWMQRLQVKEDPQRPYMLACRKHFSEAQFRNSVNGKQLTSDAVPDMFIVEEEDCQDTASLEEPIPSPLVEKPLVDSVCRLCLVRSDNLQTLFPMKETDDCIGPSIVLRTLGVKIELKADLPSGCCLTCINTIKSIRCVRERFQETDWAMHQNFEAAVEAANQTESPTPSETQAENADTLQLEIYEEARDGEQADDDTELTVVEVEDLRYVQPMAKRSRLGNSR
ncbi:uncharacterized protein LOC129723656 [Wyeomyia smithii]|uniref:uncharacterized protein LOC129723656 n=1 Tax=Wyeomyia smithii TaxID=174621 RepID=UPI002467D0E4|nr:uncharacterized protein LOC129723656 [Wyeomyia smithii]